MSRRINCISKANIETSKIAQIMVNSQICGTFGGPAVFFENSTKYRKAFLVILNIAFKLKFFNNNFG